MNYKKAILTIATLGFTYFIVTRVGFTAQQYAYLRKLNPKGRRRFKEFIKAIEDNLGYSVIITSGYRTFEKLWSEKYDQMDTWQERTDAILANLRQWCSLTLEEKQAKIKLVWEDLLHNQQMVSNTQSDETRSEYLADIVRAMSSGG